MTLARAEYFARYNLGYDVPFVNYTNSIVFFDKVSEASRGATRPTWELLYSHYVQIKGLDAPWTTKYLNYTLNEYGGFEPGAGTYGEGSGHYDGLGWGSLLYHMDESDVEAAVKQAGGGVSANAAAAAVSSSSVSVAATASAASSGVEAKPKPTQAHHCRRRHRAR